MFDTPSFTIGRASLRLAAEWRFAWRPAWRGFPSFGATLTVAPADNDTDLVLEGSYEPPGGVFGRLFDRVVGHKLAARTMDALLTQLALHAENKATSSPTDVLT